MANPIPLFLLFVAVLPFLSTTAISEADPCMGRRIHIRRLPPRFNTQLLRHCAADFPLSDPAASLPFSCESLANHGLGPRTHNRSQSWFRTDPHLLEPFFHYRLLDHPCLVSSPSLADAVFLPYYAALDSLPFLLDPSLLNSSSLHGLSLSRFLRYDNPDIIRRRHGHDHFFVLAGSAWDYSQDPYTDPRLWGTTSLLRHVDFLNFTVLALESRAWPWQEHAIPHPTSFHPATLPRLATWITRARRSHRTVLMLFAGGGAGAPPPARPNIRAAIHAECANRTDACLVVDCSGGTCAHDPVKYMRPMLRAKFCLQPSGDTPARRSTFDAILAGCVPVFFEEVAARRQYGWHLPAARYDEFSVMIPKEAVVFGGVKIADELARIPEEEVRRKRERVLEMAPRVMYRRHDSTAELREAGKDAFDIAIDGVLRRIRRRVGALEGGDPDRIYAQEGNDVEQDDG